MDRVSFRYLLSGVAGLALLIAFAGLFFQSKPAGPVIPEPHEVASLPNLPLEQPTGGYVGSAACKSCHPNQHGSWHESYHRRMTQVASDESVLGDFNNVRLIGKDLGARLFKEDGQYKAEISLDNFQTTHVYTVVMTTGSHVRQAYWLADPDDKQLMLLPFMYLRAEQRWIPRPSGYIGRNSQSNSSELTAFQAEKGRWQFACIRCHTTHGQAVPTNEAGQSLPTPRVAEFGISCEACHGEGAAHVQAKRNPVPGRESMASIVNPGKLPHDLSSQVCGQCHAVLFPRSNGAMSHWQRNGDTFRPGDDLFADPICHVMRGHLNPVIDKESFWPDGMVRVTGREFTGLIESACYQRGKMSCLSCHEMHQHNGDTRPPNDWAAGQLKPGMDGNRACVQCHGRFDDVEVIARHTHHQADSSGSKCYNCHMPHTTYGLLKAARSHQISSPNVAQSLQAGRPNACNQCHLDQTLAWTAENLASWYNQQVPTLSDEEEHVAAAILWALRGDAGQRALTAWSLGWAEALETSGDAWQAPFLGQLLNDRYNAVRFIAHRSLKRLPGFADFDYDFVSEPSVRAAAVEKARSRWRESRSDASPSFSRRMLIDPMGQIIEAEFQRILQQRDESPVELAE